jgi:hypothetical protein
MKIQQEEEELKHCTFQPNIEKGSPEKVHETINKLYQDGVNKVKNKRSLEEIKEPIITDPDELTFHPKVNPL